MRLDNASIHEFLVANDITHLHHANSLATSITFFRAQGLLSRGFVESQNLFQTRQLSDDDDKNNDVWNDIFFDSRDLHGHFPRQNLYGPILFKFNIDLLLKEDLQIYITKSNPMFWDEKTKPEDKYFLDMDDVRDNWNKYELQRKMITVRFQDAPIDFEHLEKIIIDDPHVIIYGKTELLHEATRALNAELNKYPELKKLVELRNCGGNCFCKTNYLNQYNASKLAKFFLPNTHPHFNNS
ncbi:hypothetical protein [Mucilaginibacter endophyticus]|uniref:hypothetical protein n=1 Tax=Mucilaginibacter endophyticus TaxID=2675003 RepID=UPI000E0D1178|nr:hypothetical protein [Mucilaginibacter endophyticus]